MAGLKEIRRRIKSVQNTRKITYAMKLVSAAKLRKAQDALEESEDYCRALNDLLVQLTVENAEREFSHPLMDEHEEIKAIKLLVIGGSKGLCGPFNSNINKKITALLKEKEEKSPELGIESVVVGSKPGEYYRRSGYEYAKLYDELPKDFSEWPVDELAADLEDAFTSGEIDEAHVLYTRFRSAMSSEVVVQKLLPMQAELVADEEQKARVSGVILFEPSIDRVFDAAVPRIFRSRVRQALLHSLASEHGSRMTAMDSATNNAGDLLDSLRLTHNKLRQSGITAELLDIIGGSAAIS